MKNILFLFLLISATTLFAQDQFEISPLLNGVGMNAILNNAVDYTTQSKKEGKNTLTYHEIKDGQLTFLGNPVTNAVVMTKNGLVNFIGCVIEKKDIETPQFSDENFDKALVEHQISDQKASAFRRGKILEFIGQNIPITQKAEQYLSKNHTFISEDPQCQFDCSYIWKSEYTEIFIEKNNYADTVNNQTKVYIDQSLIIKSTLF